MKYIPLCLLTLLAITACTGRNGYDALLTSADSLLNQRPDSVIQLLQGPEGEPAGLSTRQRMHRCLLFTAAQNKCDTVFRSDSLQRVLADYYDLHGTPNERMRAHYLLGRAYSDMGEAPRALQCFQDAAACADTTAADCDYHTLVSIYGQMAYLFEKQRMSKEEIDVLKLCSYYAKKDNDTFTYIKAAIRDSYDRLIAPAIERELRNQLTEGAEDGAIRVFASNLEQLLMQQPIAGKVVLGWDPAFRTGCKLAVADPTGRILDTKVIYPTAPQNKVREAKQELHKLVTKYNVSVISVGNGTASRESEQVITEFIREEKKPIQYVIVNEAGASVYSASKLAAEEFPKFDVGQRSAASIARRLQDPLAELVKIDPKAIGVGQYQHDMNQKKLDGALTGVVEKCVNRVGVDLNTASFSLLSYISGISKTVAKNIVSYREENGAFKNRKELLKVTGLGPKAFQQCAGFLRIRGGSQPLDETSVHPESYGAVAELMKGLGLEMNRESFKAAVRMVSDPAAKAAELGIGEPTLRDILQELEKPARDPREEMPAPVLRSDVLSMEDLKPGMKLKGTVRNIVDFGAFVDIGVHQDGLVHISKMSRKFIKHPLEVVRVGDVVDVTVIGVDAGKKRISLSMVED